MSKIDRQHFYKKSLGQNFLKYSKYARELVDNLRIEANDLIIEIGPGNGIVTDILSKSPVDLILIEKDSSLFERLKFKYPKALVINEDIMNINIPELTNGKDYKVIGSLPYNISKLIIHNFLNYVHPPELMSFIIQKEVAAEYNAKAPRASLIGTLTKLNADITLGSIIPSSAFFPVPKVDGRIVKFQNIKISTSDLIKIKSLIKMGYSHPRKVLPSNLNAFDKEIVKQFLISNNLDVKIRASELTNEEWVLLYKYLNGDGKR